ncbi:septum site-determining protein MinC, partial [Escherichia coli]
MSNTPIELKGSSFTLSVVHLHEAEPKVIHQALEDKIAQAPAFLKHAPVVLNVSALEDPVNWSAMHKAVSATGLRVIGVSGCKDAQLKAEIEKMGLPILTEGKEKAPRPAPAPQAPAQNTTPVTKTRLIDTPVRSGQRIYAPQCDLIVTSHVSAGAELIADGNIHV